MIALRDEATGNGLMDVALPWLVEGRMRPEAQRSEEMISVYRRKMHSVADWLEQNIEEIAARPFDIGHLAIAVALAYLDFHFPHEEWQKGRPKLAKWHKEILERPSFKATTFRDDPRPAG